MKNKIALYGDDPESSDLIEVLVEGYFDIEVKRFQRSLDIEDAIRKNPKSFFAIIYNSESKSITQSTLYLANVVTTKLPFIHIYTGSSYERSEYSSFFSDSPFHFVLLKNQISKDLINILNQIMKKWNRPENHGDNYEKDGRKLFAIRPIRVFDSPTAKSDIFVKIGDNKFIKVLNKDQPIDKELIERIIQKGGKYLYQDEEDYKKQVLTMVDKLKKAFQREDLDSKGRMTLELKTIKEVQDAVRNMGITEEVIQTTDELVKSIEKMVLNNKDLSPFIQNLLAAKSNLFTRTAMTNYFLGGIFKKVSWMSFESFKKLIYASIFCDFSFDKEDESLAFILSIDEEEYRKLDESSKKKIKAHPFRSAALIEQHRDFLTDEVNIINLHHELPDGTGFPKGLDYKKTPILTCIFILVYNFSNALVRSTVKKEDLNAAEVFEKLPHVFKLGNFNKGYLALKEVLKIP